MHRSRIRDKSLNRPWCRDISCNSWCALQKTHRHADTAPRKRHLETFSCMHSICLGFPLRCPRKEGQGMPSMASGFEKEGFSLLSLCNAGVTDSFSRSDILVALLFCFCFFSFFCFCHCCVCFCFTFRWEQWSCWVSAQRRSKSMRLQHGVLVWVFNNPVATSLRLPP